MFQLNLEDRSRRLWHLVTVILAAHRRYLPERIQESGFEVLDVFGRNHHGTGADEILKLLADGFVQRGNGKILGFVQGFIGVGHQRWRVSQCQDMLGFAVRPTDDALNCQAALAAPQVQESGPGQIG